MNGITVGIVIAIVFGVTYATGLIIAHRYRMQRLPRWQDENKARTPHIEPVGQLDPLLPMAAQVEVDGECVTPRFPPGSVTKASERDGLTVVTRAEDRVTPATDKARRGILGLIR